MGCRWALALQMVVLACTLAAWATSYVHSFKNSLWGMAAVVAFVCIECCNQIYFSWQWSTVSRVGGGRTRGLQPAATLANTLVLPLRYFSPHACKRILLCAVNGALFG